MMSSKNPDWAQQNHTEVVQESPRGDDRFHVRHSSESQCTPTAPEPTRAQSADVTEAGFNIGANDTGRNVLCAQAES